MSEVDDHELLGRAVRNARDTTKRKGTPHPRWVAVMHVFLLGSTSAQKLCSRFGLDPDTEVKT
jgi:hypothetical protein